MAWLVASNVNGQGQNLIALLAFAGTALANFVTWMRKGLHAVDTAIGQLETARDEVVRAMTEEQRNQQKAIESELDDMRSKRLDTSRELDEAKAELAKANASQQRLDLNTFLFEWIVERSSRTAYRDQLGIISYIREDFEDLGRILAS